LFTIPSAKAQEVASRMDTTIVQQESYPEIVLDSAVTMARQSYPSLQTGKLEIQRQNVLKASAYDLGRLITLQKFKLPKK